MTNIIFVETRRSKGVHKADISALDKDQVKAVLTEYQSNSYVAVKNYRTDSFEIKFEKMKAKGLASYSLKTSLTEEDFKAIGFVKTEKGNYHLTEKGCSINKFDVEVKEPVKKIASRKKEEKAADDKKPAAKKAPLPTAKAPLPSAAKAKVEEKAKAEEADDTDEDEE